MGGVSIGLLTLFAFYLGMDMKGTGPAKSNVR